MSLEKSNARVSYENLETVAKGRMKVNFIFSHWLGVSPNAWPEHAWKIVSVGDVGHCH